MNVTEREFLRDQLAHLRLDLHVAAYTKVPVTWKDDDYTPDFNKLYYIVEGEGYVEVEDKLYYPKPGQLYLLPAGVMQSYGTTSENTYGKYWCHFGAKIGGLDLFLVAKTPQYIDVKDQTLMCEKFDQLLYWYRSSDLTSKIRITSILLDIISSFLEQCDLVKVNTNHVASLEKVQGAIDYIQAHLSDKLSVDELAKHLHFHPNYFIRIFKKTTGLSPVQYINRMRIERAKHLLTSSGAHVLSIADELGMDIGYFSRMFKGYTGFTPTRYREMFSE